MHNFVDELSKAACLAPFKMTSTFFLAEFDVIILGTKLRQVLQDLLSRHTSFPVSLNRVSCGYPFTTYTIIFLITPVLVDLVDELINGFRIRIQEVLEDTVEFVVDPG